MLEFLRQLQWLDWIGMALAAYGVVAGACRGLLPQSTRLLALFLGLAVVGLLGTPVLTALGAAFAEGHDATLLGARLELALLLVVYPGLVVARRLALGEGQPPQGWFGRLGGALAGLLGSFVLATVIGCAAYWIEGDATPTEARGGAVGRTITEWVAGIPAPPRPSFLVPRCFPR